VDITGWRERAFVNVPTAAAILDIVRSLAWEMVYRGELPSRTFGKSRKIAVSALIALETETTRQATGDGGGHHVA
jgi:hypothetical protein